jgi:toxin HigB-1
VRDRDHVRFVAHQTCLVCGRRPCDAHHLRFAPAKPATNSPSLCAGGIIASCIAMVMKRRGGRKLGLTRPVRIKDWLQTRPLGANESAVVDPGTERIWQGQSSRRFPSGPQNRALRKLRQLDAAATVEDLRNPPGNRLEALKGDRAGQMSIRINDQWRICFRWAKGDAYDVAIADYHS